MKTVSLSHVTTATPPLILSQGEIEKYFFRHLDLRPAEKNLYHRFLKDPGIQQRAIAADEPEEVFDRDLDANHRRFSRWSVELSAKALRELLGCAGLKPEDIDGLIVATCTGYLCPGLSSYLIEECALSPSARTLDLVGLGCGAAIPALRAGRDMLLNPDVRRVAVICVEICTATAVWENKIDLILSNSIFGDGAAACLLEKDSASPGIVLEDFTTLTLPEYREDLRYHTRQGRLVNTLSSRVAGIVASGVRALHSEMAGEDRFKMYAFHTGGRKILDAIEETLQLSEQQMEASRRVLKDYGNMSSPCLLFAIKNLMQQERETLNGSLGLFSFGAGFTAFGAKAFWTQEKGKRDYEQELIEETAYSGPSL